MWPKKILGHVTPPVAIFLKDFHFFGFTKFIKLKLYNIYGNVNNRNINNYWYVSIRILEKSKFKNFRLFFRILIKIRIWYV